MFVKVKDGRKFIGRFNVGEDVLVELNKFCEKHKIKLGVFNLIGALKAVKLGYYDQIKKKYVYCLSLKKKLEIASCMGNISLKDGKNIVHAHITLADLKGHTFGGHLLEGSEIFAAEFFIQELLGAKLERVHENLTGLPLWRE